MPKDMVSERGGMGLTVVPESQTLITRNTVDFFEYQSLASLGYGGGAKSGICQERDQSGSVYHNDGNELNVCIPFGRLKNERTVTLDY